MTIPQAFWPHVNRIGTAVPDHDVHQPFLSFARTLLGSGKPLAVFDRMAERSGIAHRYSFFRGGEPGSGRVDADGFYNRGHFPGTGARMRLFERDSVTLALRAVAALDEDPARFTHIVVASCTGFMAPGLDQILAERLGMRPALERTMVGFMGCYAGVSALKTAAHIVRSDPAARVLVVNLELCTLHLQESDDLETVLSFMLFGDGCSAALVSADPAGIALHGFHAVTLPDSADLITWRIGDQGFDMRLSGKVPGRIAATLRAELDGNTRDGVLQGQSPAEVDLWAVHAGGRTVLDAVEQGLRLAPAALRHSRAVLNDFGNMSSATIMFILDRMIREGAPQNGNGNGNGNGIGMAFGPGLAAEAFRFAKV